MTKTEFQQEARKAGVNPNLYGIIVNTELPDRNGYYVTGGKITGIVWYNTWQTSSEYSYVLGKHDVTTLRPEPFVVLRKNRQTYEVPVWQIQKFTKDLLNNLLISMAKEQKKARSKHESS